MSDNWQDSPILLAAAFEGMAGNQARPVAERLELALQAIRHLHEHIDALEAAEDERRLDEQDQAMREPS